MIPYFVFWYNILETWDHMVIKACKQEKRGKHLISSLSVIVIKLYERNDIWNVVWSTWQDTIVLMLNVFWFETMLHSAQGVESTNLTKTLTGNN